jgi:hypothetical protein
LQAKNPTRLDQEIAHKLQVIALEKLALDAGLPLVAQELERFLEKHADVRRDAALVTWAVEVLRRGEYRGQGVPVLALWREVAWKEGRLDRKFEPTAELVLAAEARIGAALRKAYAAESQ